MCNSPKDEKILTVIFQTIGDYPHELKYRKLNVKNTTKILDNAPLSLSLLLQLGFRETSNKCEFEYIGISRYLANEKDIDDLLIKKRISLILIKSVIRAGCHTDENMRHIFDNHSYALVYGKFVMKQRYFKDYNLSDIEWQKHDLADKIQIALCFKEMYTVNSIYDIFIFIIPKSILYVFNNNGSILKAVQHLFNDNIYQSMYDFYQCWSPIASEQTMHMKNFNNAISDLNASNTNQNKIYFLKACIFFFQWTFDTLV